MKSIKMICSVKSIMKSIKMICSVKQHYEKHKDDM